MQPRLLSALGVKSAAEGLAGTRESDSGSEIQNALGQRATSHAASTMPGMSTQGPLATTAMATMLAVSAADPDRERRRHMVAQDEEALDGLEELDRAMALGKVDHALLSRLSAMAEREDEAGTPEELRQIRGDIRMRIEIELAKLEMSGGGF